MIVSNHKDPDFISYEVNRHDHTAESSRKVVAKITIPRRLGSNSNVMKELTKFLGFLEKNA